MSTYQRACACVEKQETDLLKTLQAIVAIDNGVPPGRNYDRVVDLLEPYFQRLGFATERVIVPEERLRDIPFQLEGPRVNLVARRRHGKEPVTIYGHIDTWPVGQGWHFDPFGGEVSGGYMYGNGISDVKGNIGALITALGVMDELGIEPRFDLICCLCTDKEILYYPGVHYLAEKGYVEGHLLQLAGTTEPREDVGYMGMLAVEIVACGENDYDAPMQVNALEGILPILEELAKLKIRVQERVLELPPWPYTIRYPPRLRSELSMDGIHASFLPRTVPGQCRLLLHRFYLPEENEEEVEAELREAVARGQARSRLLDVQVRVLYRLPSLRLNEESPHRQQMRQSYAAARGLKGVKLIRRFALGPCEFAAAARLVGGDWVNVGASRPDECHAHHADERVRISDLIIATKQLIHYLSDLS